MRCSPLAGLASADVGEETQAMDGVGRFGWFTDPEGNRVELWQPASITFLLT